MDCLLASSIRCLNSFVLLFHDCVQIRERSGDGDEAPVSMGLSFSGLPVMLWSMTSATNRASKYTLRPNCLLAFESATANGCRLREIAMRTPFGLVCITSARCLIVSSGP